MKRLLCLALLAVMAATGVAQERVARIGYLSWQDSGPYYESTLKEIGRASCRERVSLVV